MRIMREILVDVTKAKGVTVLISSHILGELEKIATHYGILRQGKMIVELSAKEMESRAIGHLTAVKKMIEEGRECSEVLIQLSAIRAENS